jgi:hypothetical protein
MFETTIVLPDGVQSFDLTFISGIAGGALTARGAIFIDDVSASIIAAPVLSGDHNGDSIVDAADYVAWRKYGGPTGYDTWRTHFAATTNGAGSSEQNPSVPEPTALILLCVGTMAARIRGMRGVTH